MNSKHDWFLVAVTPGKALLPSLLPFRLQGQRCMSGLAVRILEVVASPVRRSGPVRILETPSGNCLARRLSAVSVAKNQ